MTLLTGTEQVIGFSKSTAWGTAIAVAADDQAPAVSVSLNPDVKLLNSEALTGTPFRGEGEKGDEFYAGPLSFEADYETIHRILAYAFGQAVAPAQQGADLAWLHDISVIGDSTGIHSTLVVGQLGLFVREFTTVKWGQITLRFEGGQDTPPTLEVEMFAHNMLTDDSGVNTLTTLPNITLRKAPTFIKFEDIVVRMNDTSAGALSSSDEVCLKAFEITLSPQLRGDNVTTCTAPFISEPARNGFFDVTGSLEFSEIENDTIIELARSKTPQKIDLVATGPIAEGSSNFSLGLEMSSVQFNNPGDIGPADPGIAEMQASFVSMKAVTNPTGFAHLDAIRASVINTDSVQQPS